MVVVVGSGFSIASGYGTLGWLDLLKEVAKRLRLDKPETAGGPSSSNSATPMSGQSAARTYVDPMVQALSLERQAMRAGRRQGSRAEPPLPGATPLQSAVARVLAKERNENVDPGDAAMKVAASFVKFLDAVDASIIVDLNYDPAVPSALQMAKRDYFLATGSDVHWVGPVSTREPLVWKIHGNLERPSTIVLSPLDYQRRYEINALGRQLETLARSAETIWALGAGLQDDDVWASLFRVRNPFRVFAVLMTDVEEKGDQVQDRVQPWLDICGDHRNITIYTSSFNNGPKPALAGVLDQIGDQVWSARREDRGAVPEERLSKSLLARCREFDERYRFLLEHEDYERAHSLALAFQSEFYSLRDFLLSARSGGFGPTWYSSINGRELSATSYSEVVADSIAVVRCADAMCERYIDWEQNTGVIFAAAAQAAVTYVAELIPLLGGTAEVELSNAIPLAAVAEGQVLLVGMNPFIVEARQLPRTNLMHFFAVEHALPVPTRIYARKDWSGTEPLIPAGARSEPTDLLTEDEWEALVIHNYRKRTPSLRLSHPHHECGHGASIGLTRVPPLFPWGFRLSEITKFRRGATGGVSQRWHLVASQISESHQICKGGSLRDRDPRSFMVGTRGTVLRGEHDDFIEPAFRTESRSTT